MLSVDWFYDRMKLIKKFAKDVAVPEVAICIPLEYKTAALAFELSKYTDVVVTRLDDYSTKKEVVEWLKDKGVKIKRKRDAIGYEYFLDCAAILSRVAAKSGKDKIKAVELTKTGEDYLKAMGDRVKAISVDSSTLKGQGENVHGTAFGLLDALMRLNVYLPGKSVLIVGFGRVGRGCARLLRSIGCKVKVMEVDEIKKIEAIYDGFELAKDLGSADIVITSTGKAGVINDGNVAQIKSGAIVLNLGAEMEISISAKPVKDYGDVKKYEANGKEVFIVSDGYAANLAIANGSPIEVMDRTFSAAILSLNYLDEDFVGVRPLPLEVEKKIGEAMSLEF